MNKEMTTKEETVKQRREMYNKLYNDINDDINSSFDERYKDLISSIKEDEKIHDTFEENVLLVFIESSIKDVHEQLEPDNGILSMNLFFTNYILLKSFFNKAISVHNIELKEKTEEEIIESYDFYSCSISDNKGDVSEIKICQSIVSDMHLNMKMARMLYNDVSISKLIESSYFMLQLLKYAVDKLYESKVINDIPSFDGSSYESYIKYKEDMDVNEKDNSLEACRYLITSSYKERSMSYNKIIGSMILKLYRDIKNKTYSFSNVEDFTNSNYSFSDAYIYMYSLHQIAVVAAELINISIDSIKEDKDVSLEKKEEICFSSLQQCLYLFDIHLSFIMDDIKAIGKKDELNPGMIGEFYNHVNTLILIHDRIIYLQCEHQK